MLLAAQASTIPQMVISLALTNTPLLAMNATALGSHVLSLHLPDDQWEIELNYWQSIAMAQLQRTIVQWGTGQIAAHPQYLVHPPPDEPDQWFCKNMMIRSTVYQSFSVLALGLIVASGLVVIVVSLTIEDTATWVQRRARNGPRQRDSWDRDDMLKLRKAIRGASVRPPPPPKDDDKVSPGQGTEVHTLGSAHSLREVHRTFDKSPPNFSYPKPQALPFDGNGGRSRHTHTSPATATPRILSRIWSDLPHTPARDSWVDKKNEHPPDRLPINDTWVEMKYEGGDVMPSMGAIHLRDRDMRGCTPQQTPESSRAAGAFAITGLRDHALARMKGTWI